MTANVGGTDRILRAAIGIVLIAGPFATNIALFESTLATVISVIAGLVMLGVAATSICPIYALIGYSTCRSA